MSTLISRRRRVTVVGCQVCNHPVTPRNRYFSTFCGTFCRRCMALHARECAVCAEEFGLPGPPRFKTLELPDGIRERRVEAIDADAVKILERMG